jgi:hypothetical protein
MTILESLKEIIQEHDRLFYVQRHFNTIAAISGLFLFVLSLVLLLLPGTSWPWFLSIWTSGFIAYIACRSRWFQADSDIIGSAMEKFNHAFPVNTNERKIAMHTLEEMSSSSVTAATIVALLGGKRSLHYYYGWTESPVKPKPLPETPHGTQHVPVGKKRLIFGGIIPLQMKKKKISDLHEDQTNNKCIRLDPDRPGRKIT